MNGWLDKKKHRATEREKKRLRKLERQKREKRQRYLRVVSDLFIEIYGKTIESISKGITKALIS